MSLKLSQSTAGIWLPDGVSEADACRRITHLGIGAHQDDLEFMAFHGIQQCYDDDARWFGGVTCTNGSGSSRIGPFASCSDREMMALRWQEQETAAAIGRYGLMLQLDHASAEVRNPTASGLQEDLATILRATQPEVVYTHNPADKHETHLAVTVAALQAMRELPRELRPGRVIGCEVWRGLDWMVDADKVLMDVSDGDEDRLADSLNAVFASQIAGGKRYDLAIAGRRRANATFLDSHSSDAATQVIYGMDLTPLVQDETLDLVDFTVGFIERFQQDVVAKLKARLDAAAWKSSSRTTR